MRKLEEWIDYMEDEAPLQQHAELTMLLRHSAADRIVFENLTRLRQLIALCDPADAIEGVISRPDFLEKLHSQIVSSITEVAAPREENPQSPERGLLTSQETYKR